MFITTCIMYVLHRISVGVLRYILQMRSYQTTVYRYKRYCLISYRTALPDTHLKSKCNFLHSKVDLDFNFNEHFLTALPCTCCFDARQVFPGKFLLQPMDLGSCRGFTGSNSIPRHKSYSHDLRSRDETSDST